jgi:hypothetical protein
MHVLAIMQADLCRVHPNKKNRIESYPYLSLFLVMLQPWQVLQLQFHC